MKDSLYFNMQMLRLSFLFELFCFLDCIQIAPPLMLWIFPPFIIPNFLQSELNVNCMLPQYCCAGVVVVGQCPYLTRGLQSALVTASQPQHPASPLLPSTAICQGSLLEGQVCALHPRQILLLLDPLGFIWDPLGEK